MKIDSLMLTTGDTSYYDPAFRRMIEDHLVLLRTDPNATIRDVEPEDAYVYNGNFWQLLSAMGMKDLYMHWIIMRVTGLKQPTDPIVNLRQIIIPSITVVKQLMTAFKQTNTKIK